MGGMPQAVDAEHGLREPTNRDHPPSRGEGCQERSTRLDLSHGRAPVRRLVSCLVRMGRDDVPEECPLPDSELVEHAPDDRRGGLRRPASGELSLGGERNPRHTSAAVPRRLTDEEQVCAVFLLEVRDEALAEKPRPWAARVLVERRPDTGASEPLDELGGDDWGYDMPSVTGSSGQPG